MVVMIFSYQLSFSEDFQGRILHSDGEEHLLRPGEIFDGVIRIWPYPYGKVDKFYSIAGTRFIDMFYVSAIEKIGFSKNNRDVLEIHATMVLYKSFGNDSFYVWKFDGKNIPITIKNLKTVEFELKRKELIIYDQSENWNYGRYLYEVIFIICGVVFFIGWIYHENLKRKRLQILIDQREMDKVNYWDSKFKSAKKRKDYEEIYGTRNEWIYYMNDYSSEVTDFLQMMNCHQYKEKWENYEIRKIEDSFKSIRDVIAE